MNLLHFMPQKLNKLPKQLKSVFMLHKNSIGHTHFHTFSIFLWMCVSDVHLCSFFGYCCCLPTKTTDLIEFDWINIQHYLCICSILQNVSMSPEKNCVSLRVDSNKVKNHKICVRSIWKIQSNRH